MKLQKTIALYGAKVEALGKALQKPDSTLVELQNLASNCGMKMHILIGVGDEDPKEGSNGN